jgi:hypothetical protein
MWKKWQADASVGNLDGVFDCAYSFGQDSRVVGTPAQVAEAVRRYLESLSDENIEAMKYGTSRFFVQFDVMALPEGPSESQVSDPSESIEEGRRLRDSLRLYNKLTKHIDECPFCGAPGTEFNVGDPDFDGTGATIDVECETCHKRWLEFFELVGAEEDED